jgi:hypothetical protein
MDLTCRCRGKADSRCWWYPVDPSDPLYDEGYPTPATGEDGLCDDCRRNGCKQVRPSLNPAVYE